ncbi:MAG: MarR family transcriptional regulator [Sporolactobacillus sp.]
MKTDNTIFLMGRISEKADRFLTEALRQAGLKGIAPSHGDIIANLLKCGEAKLTHLAELICRDPSPVTVLVGKLRQQGIVAVRRSLTDSRVALVALTDKGKALGPLFASISAELYAREYKGVTAEEQAMLRGLLARINRNF